MEERIMMGQTGGNRSVPSLHRDLTGRSDRNSNQLAASLPPAQLNLAHLWRSFIHVLKDALALIFFALFICTTGVGIAFAVFVLLLVKS
jgi:hypothetical protein